MSKSKRAARPPVPPNDLTLAGGRLRDLAAVRRSAEEDAAVDRQWFLDHPDQDERRRPATLNEIIACNCPPGTMVTVIRGPFGSQIRMIEGS